MSEETDLYSIGTLSKIVGVSTDTLRYYDEIDLLKPMRISSETGYRYYSNDQAKALVQIMELKYYGFSLNEIKDILKQGEVSLTSTYLNRYWALESEKAKLQEAIDQLADKIKKRQEDFIMGKKILLVDDAPFMRSICKEILIREDYDVVGEACDGLEAVELFKSLKPDIVLLDIVMPNCNGVEALKKIKAFDTNAQIIMVSAMSRSRIISESLLAGARDFVVKPFQPEELLNRIRDSLLVERSFNQAMLQQIYDASINDTDILSQAGADIIMKNAHTLNEIQDVKDILAVLRNKKQSHSQSTDNAEIFERLSKLEQGQEEIKEILLSLK